ncbi:hypothetical protein [Shewanella glacialipiscicola]|uniref:Uncharacterized protein n=1 Tax=Shewanella glacialipiscicola TaxID=614069 RepID=A0ABQ6J408_9GAMM|nr:hypothetical protein [Shewanella glacialipiscicola]MCL1084763.1 hypothetical protein [Shewanella glacialipiscicola]GMA82284.1 hypothetical protein GCM10025855_18170 [Shewanella glacialipiscicola]
MTETTEQRTKRKFKDVFKEYKLNYLTSIQFNAEASEQPEYIIELYQKLRKSISKKHDGVLIFWLRTLKAKTQFRFPMICIFTQTAIDIDKVKLTDERFVYKKLNKQWNESNFNSWINKKEMFNDNVYRDFYNLSPEGKRSISRLAIINKSLALKNHNEEAININNIHFDDIDRYTPF